MVKRICLSLGIIIMLNGCDTKLQPLIMDKTPYDGDELRIDGYYYSDITDYDKYADVSYVYVAVFYSDGSCIHTGIHAPANPDDTISKIENEILLNNDFITKNKAIPSEIGVFKILYPNITIEHWAYRNETVSHYGEIIDETAFVINKKVSNRTGQVWKENLTYHFQEFSPLPDPTNKYVRALELFE